MINLLFKIKKACSLHEQTFTQKTLTQKLQAAWFLQLVVYSKEIKPVLKQVPERVPGVAAP